MRMDILKNLKLLGTLFYKNKCIRETWDSKFIFIFFFLYCPHVWNNLNEVNLSLRVCFNFFTKITSFFFAYSVYIFHSFILWENIHIFVLYFNIQNCMDTKSLMKCFNLIFSVLKILQWSTKVSCLSCHGVDCHIDFNTEITVLFIWLINVCIKTLIKKS